MYVPDTSVGSEGPQMWETQPCLHELGKDPSPQWALPGISVPTEERARSSAGQTRGLSSSAPENSSEEGLFEMLLRKM